MKKHGPSKKLVFKLESVKQLSHVRLVEIAGGQRINSEQAHCSDMGGCVPIDP